MNNIDLIAIAVGIVVIVKLLYSFYKRDRVNEKQTHNVSTGEKILDTSTDEIIFNIRYVRISNIGTYVVRETNLKPPGEVRPEMFLNDKVMNLMDEFGLMERPEISKNNKWLYPKDGFGKMEHGVDDDESKEEPKKKKKVIYLDDDAV